MTRNRRITANNYKLFFIYKRIAHFYLRSQIKTITIDELKAAEWHFKRLMNFAHHFVSQIANNKQSYTDKAWQYNT
jgi:hypothetical protein